MRVFALLDGFAIVDRPHPFRAPGDAREAWLDSSRDQHANDMNVRAPIRLVKVPVRHARRRARADMARAWKCTITVPAT